MRLGRHRRSGLPVIAFGVLSGRFVDERILDVARSARGPGDGTFRLVVARPGASLTAEQIAAHCATRLARFKSPTVIRVVEALPHSATGKVAKGRLRDVYGDTGYGA